MKFKIIFTLYAEGGRTNPVFNAYRPDWTCPINKPDYNCGSVVFDGECIKPGETREVYLVPLREDLWEKVEVGDIITAKEGNKSVGEGKVIGVEK